MLLNRRSKASKVIIVRPAPGCLKLLELGPTLGQLGPECSVAIGHKLAETMPSLADYQPSLADVQPVLPRVRPKAAQCKVISAPTG